jgi:HD-like signal output (HDOD) protein
MNTFADVHTSYRSLPTSRNDMSNTAEKPSLEEVFRVEVLPALPHSAISLLQLSQREDAGPNDFARPIEADPGLMGQVLRFVNSSYFGFSREIMSISQAITLVGSRAITNFALWNAVFSVIPNPKFGPFDLKSLWQDSLRRAVFARLAGKHLKLKNSEDLFAGALLQDMAIPLLLKELPEKYEALVEQRAINGQRLSGLEKELFGWDHAEAAAMLAGCWNLPEEFVALIAQHTQMEELLGKGEVAHGAACVALASLLPSCCDETWHERDEFLSAFRELIGTDPEVMQSIMADTDEQTAEFAPLMKLSVPAKSLVEFIHEQEEVTA